MEPEATIASVEVVQEPIQQTTEDVIMVDAQQEMNPESQPEPALVNVEPLVQNPTPIDEIDKAFIVCSDIIDKPPDEYRYGAQNPPTIFFPPQRECSEGSKFTVKLFMPDVDVSHCIDWSSKQCWVCSILELVGRICALS
jgi:hypothetical protein